MKTTRRKLLLVAAATAAFALAPLPFQHPSALAAEAKAEAGWTALLDGELTTHWQTQGNWKLENGVATLTPDPGDKGWSRWNEYLWSKKEYDDFEIKFDYMVQKSGNSGFYFNVGDRHKPVETGVEVQIYDSASVPDSKKLNDHDSGGVIPGIAPTKRVSKPAGEWNSFHITVKGDQLTVALNGEKINEVDLTQGRLASRPKKGFIGFQDHSLPLQLKDIRIRDLTEKK